MKVRFHDGREGIYPVEPERRDGVFLKLLDAHNSNAVTRYFRISVPVQPGTLESKL